MNQTIGGANDVSARIGALELGAINSFDDSVLETSIYAGPQRQTAIRLPGGGCLPGIDDSALEATVQAGPSTRLRNGPVCLNIDDGALEAMAMGPMEITRALNCIPPHRIDDDALEASALSMDPMRTVDLRCRTRIDDGALEMAAAHVDVGPSVQRVAGRCY